MKIEDAKIDPAYRVTPIFISAGGGWYSYPEQVASYETRAEAEKVAKKLLKEKDADIVRIELISQMFYVSQEVKDEAAA